MAPNPDLKQVLVRVRPSVHHRLPGMAARKGYRSVNEYISTLLEAEMEQDKTQLASLREATAKKSSSSTSPKAKSPKKKRNDKPQAMPKKAHAKSPEATSSESPSASE